MLPNAIAIAMLAASAPPLTIGSLAPKFDVAGFVKGEPVKELARGTMYVIEFSGVQCVPCIKAIPLLTELQKKYPEIVIISVYGDSESEVRESVAQHVNKIGFRVALDRSGQMTRTWLESAGWTGNPAAFVIGKDGNIAWLGNANDLPKPLEQIVAGIYDPQFDKVRSLYNSTTKSHWNRNAAKNPQLNAINHQVAKLIEHKKWADALYLIADARREYPDNQTLFDLHQMRVLVANPESADAAIDFACKLVAKVAVDDDRLGDKIHEYAPIRMLGVATELIFFRVHVFEADKNDPRVAYLGKLIIEQARTQVPSSGADPRKVEDFRITADYAEAIANAQLGQYKDAVTCLERAAEAHTKVQPPSDGDVAEWRKFHDYRKAEFESRLTEYRAKVSAGSK